MNINYKYFTKYSLVLYDFFDTLCEPKASLFLNIFSKKASAFYSVWPLLFITADYSAVTILSNLIRNIQFR